MTGTLTLDGLALPPDLLWVDEFDWTPTEQNETRTLTGALVIETAQKIAGRPITLAGTRESGWATKVQVDSVFAKLSNVGELVLVMPNGTTFNVKFRHKEKPIESKPIVDYQIMEADDPYDLTIKLMTV
jgi:hypothetical protein